MTSLLPTLSEVLALPRPRPPRPVRDDDDDDVTINNNTNTNSSYNDDADVASSRAFADQLLRQRREEAATRLRRNRQHDNTGIIRDHGGRRLNDTAEVMAMVQQLSRQITNLRHSLQASSLHLQETLNLYDLYDMGYDDLGGVDTTTAAGVPPAVLDALPRERLTDRSSILKEAQLTFFITTTSAAAAGTENGDNNVVLPVVPAELGANYANLQNVRLVVLLVATTTTTTLVEPTAAGPEEDDPVAGAIVVVHRDGRTLAQMARWAQQRGALGLVVVNDRVAPWPDVMTDSATLETNDISIPVVLAPQGTTFPNDDDSSQLIKACLAIRENTDLTCCVCTESFCHTTTILLSPCRHRFHESCAVTWLSRHNSCPYCRSSVVVG